MQNSLYIFGIFLLFFPRLGVGEVFVAETSQVHQFGLRFTELVMFDALPYPTRKFFHLFDDFLFVIGQFAAFGNVAAVVFVGKDDGSVHKVAENG